MKSVLLDASSAIILYKADLHTLLVDTYSVMLSQSVYSEICIGHYEGSGVFENSVASKKIHVHDPIDKLEKQIISGLDAGESETILLFLSGMGDFIITDDGPAARFCKRAGIPFINALMFPVVLLFAAIKDEEFCNKAMQRIIRAGRYSDEIIAFARECNCEQITFALP